ncbi:MAG: phosphoglycerate mutase [Betaproteobacteria bacterium]
MYCHLLIPALPPPPQWIEAGLLRDVRLPALETLFARGRKAPLPSGSMEAWLCRTFGIERQYDWPVAAITLLADGGSPASDYWLLADPVHLQLQRDRMVPMGAENLEISADEAASLTAALSHHFAPDGLTFQPTRPGRWHLRLARPARLETQPLEAVIGRDIRNFLPGGPDGKHWHTLLNEIQMLLHSHPVNEQREQRGALPINSVWPWGGGELPLNLAAPYAQVWADNSLARGLALAADISHAGMPATAAEWLQRAAPGTHLVVLDTLGGALLAGEPLYWKDNLLQLEKDWFGPLRQALSFGQLAGLTLHVFAGTSAQAFSASRADLWKIWRRRKPFNTFAGELSS